MPQMKPPPGKAETLQSLPASGFNGNKTDTMTGNLNAIDYLRFFEPEHVIQSLGPSVVADYVLDADRSSVVYSYGDHEACGSQEAVRFHDDIMLLFGHIEPFSLSVHQQIITDGDWIHIEFRMHGSGRESVNESSPYFINAGSCAISRYSQGSLIQRKSASSPQWRCVCIFLRPQALTHLYQSHFQSLNSEMSWLCQPHDDHNSEPRSFPLGTLETVAINDIFSAPFTGSIRRQYLYAKTRELLALAMHRIVAGTGRGIGSELTQADTARIRLARQILADELSHPLTLSKIARRVGVNRTKLAGGFKQVYGISVQAYWRELRLCRARELLMQGRMAVTEVASEIGYANTSCLTRAFKRRFGVLPKDCKYTRLTPDASFSDCD